MAFAGRPYLAGMPYEMSLELQIESREFAVFLEISFRLRFWCAFRSDNAVQVSFCVVQFQGSVQIRPVSFSTPFKSVLICPRKLTLLKAMVVPKPKFF